MIKKYNPIILKGYAELTKSRNTFEWHPKVTFTEMFPVRMVLSIDGVAQGRSHLKTDVLSVLGGTNEIFL